MATLQTNIPMMVDVPDIGNALARGMQAGQMAYTNRRGYEADQFKAQNANALMQGDPAALAGLAGFDFDEAQRARINNLNARTAEHRLSAAEAAQTAAELESVMRPLAVAYANGDEEAFNSILAQNPELQGHVTFDNAEMVFARTANTYEMLTKIMDAKDQVVQITGDLAASIGLDPNVVYNRKPDGTITPIKDSGQTINVNTGPNGEDFGDPGEGLVWQRDENNKVVLDERGAPIAIPYQGGKAWRQQQEAQSEADTAARQAGEQAELESRAGNVVIEDIGRLRKVVENSPWYSPATGLGASFLAKVAGSNAADAAALGKTIRANIGFDRLQQMREASPTGGALGQVSNMELSTLQSVLGNLEQSQSEEQFLYNLDRLNEIYTDIMAKFAAYPNAEEYGFDGETTPAQEDPNDPLGIFK